MRGGHDSNFRICLGACDPESRHGELVRFSYKYTSLIKYLKTNAFPPHPPAVYTMPVSDDPFDEVLRPPPNETPEQCQLRLSRETEAKRVSMVIDANIKAERQARRKKRIVRLLLLGQSESGQYVPYYICIFR